MFNLRSGETETDRSAPPVVEPAYGALRQVGEWLREARLRQGVELDDVAEELRIKPAYLRGLEEGDLSVMPGRPYALGFLRTYANCLGLDGDELVRRIKSAERGGGDHPELSVPTPITESRLPKAQLVMLSVALVAILYGGWRFIDGDARPPAETVAEVPDELREGMVDTLPPVSHAVTGSDPVQAFASESPDFLPPPMAEVVGRARPNAAPDLRMTEPAPEPQPGPTVTATPATTAAAIAGGEAGTGGGAGAPEGGPTIAEAEPEDEAAVFDREVGRVVASVLMEDIDLTGEETGADEEDAAEPSVSELLAGLDRMAADRAQEPRVFGRENGASRVRLEAVETSWIQVRSADRTYTYTRTLQPGDVYVVPDRADLALWTGNAGGLRVVVDGAAVPPLGGSREVKRDISLDPEDLRGR